MSSLLARTKFMRPKLLARTKSIRPKILNPHSFVVNPHRIVTRSLNSFEVQGNFDVPKAFQSGANLPPRQFRVRLKSLSVQQQEKSKAFYRREMRAQERSSSLRLQGKGKRLAGNSNVNTASCPMPHAASDPTATGKNEAFSSAQEEAVTRPRTVSRPRRCEFFRV